MIRDDSERFGMIRDDSRKKKTEKSRIFFFCMTSRPRPLHPRFISLKTNLSNLSNLSNLTESISQYMRSDFVPRDHVNEIFSKEGITKATSFRQELESKTANTSAALQEFVTENYGKFIETSKEIVHIESDLLNMSAMLNAYGAGIKEMQIQGMQFGKRNGGKDNFNVACVQQVSEDVQALNQLVDELEGLLVDRKFEQSVAIIETAYEKLDELDQKAVKSGKFLLDAKMEKLVEMVSIELQAPTLKSSDRRRFTQYLIRLGHPDKALQVFLQNRSQAIKADIRKIKFQGDLSVYISELSTVVTTAISTTCTDFRKLFADRDMMSGFIVWAVSELEAFGVIFQRQVFHADTPISKIGECMKLAFTASKSLDQHGLKIEFVLASRFAGQLAETSEKEYASMEEELKNAVAVESWISAELWVRAPKQTRGWNKKVVQGNTMTLTVQQEQRVVKLTESAKLLYDLVHRLISNLKYLLNNQLYPQTSAELYVPVVQGSIRLFEKYLFKMTEASRILANQTEAPSEDVDEDAQQLAIVANTFYLGDDLLPRMSRQFEKLFERPVPELEQFQVKLTRLYRALRDQYAQKRVPYWLFQVFHWDATFQQIYTKIDLQEDIMIAGPSSEIVRLNVFLMHIRDLVLDSLNVDALGPLLAKSLEEIFLQLNDDEAYWQYGKFGRGGLIQFLLDFKYLLASGESFVNENVQLASDALFEKVKNMLRETTPADPLNLPSPVWYTSILDMKLKNENRLSFFAVPETNFDEETEKI